MKRFECSIIETLEKTIFIEAEDEQGAYKKLKEMYYNEEVILDSSDHVDTDYMVTEAEKED